MRDALYVLFKRKRRIAVVTLACLAVAVASVLLTGPRYTASARILVSAVEGSAPAGSATQPTLVFQDHGQTARNQAELLSDPGLARPLLPALEARLKQEKPGWLDQFWNGWLSQGELREGGGDARDALYARLSRALKAKAIGDTDVVVLRFTWPDRAFAAEGLNLLLRDYQHSVSQAAEAREAMAATDEALREADAQVRALDAQLAAVPVGGDAVTLERERDRIRSRLAASQSDGDALRLDRELARRKLDSVEQAFKAGGWVDSPDAQDTPSGTPALQQTFVTLLDKHQTMLTHLPPDDPHVRAVDAQIGRVREQNYLAVKQVYTAKLAVLDARMARLQAGMQSDEARAGDIDDRLVKLEALSQTRAAAAAHAAAVQRQVDEAKLRIDAIGREVSGLRVLSPATPPLQPDQPTAALVILAAAVGGLIAGIAWAFEAEATRRTVDRSRDITRLLGLDVLARVPDLR
jgi:uncharacterized protein involved in exopolysaccharide biosynthesis